MKKISTNSLPVLSSADSGWENILVKQYNLPAGESPDDLEFLEHIINIQLSQKLLKMEWQFNGEKIQSKQMNIGEVCLTPAGSSLLNRWYSPAEFLLIKINPQLIDR